MKIDEIYNSLSRFIISGFCFFILLVFFIYTMPFEVKYPIEKDIVLNSVMIIFIIILIGIVLDLLKVYRIPKLSSNNLYKEICIGFKINIDHNESGDSYEEKIRQISNFIHEKYIRTYHEDIYEKISRARLYPDILNIFYFNTLIFTILNTISLICHLIIKNIDNDMYTKVTLLIIFLIISIAILIKSRKKIRQEYQELLQYTKSLVEKGYFESTRNSDGSSYFYKNFIDFLIRKELINKDSDGNIWVVK
jgi:hypothetical protein